MAILERAVKHGKPSRRRASTPNVLRPYAPCDMTGRDDRAEAAKGIGGGLFQPLDSSWNSAKGLRINNDLTVLR